MSPAFAPLARIDGQGAFSGRVHMEPLPPISMGASGTADNDHIEQADLDAKLARAL